MHTQVTNRLLGHIKHVCKCHNRRESSGCGDVEVLVMAALNSSVVALFSLFPAETALSLLPDIPFLTRCLSHFTLSLFSPLPLYRRCLFCPGMSGFDWPELTQMSSVLLLCELFKTTFRARGKLQDREIRQRGGESWCGGREQ